MWRILNLFFFNCVNFGAITSFSENENLLLLNNNIKDIKCVLINKIFVILFLFLN